MNIVVRPADADDPDQQAWLREAYDADWSSPRLVIDGVEHLLVGQPTLVAEEGGELCGYLVHERGPHGTQLLALAAHPRGQGVGRALVRALVEQARGPIVVVTTNDNTDALAFYQRCGFRIRSVRIGAVDRSRALKPEIPLRGEHGIEIHDEIVLEHRP